MTSERQIEANRRNSRKSCGPRTEAGRQRAARNAFKYGLSITNNDAAEINELAIKIAGPLQDLDVFECAQIIAAAEIELRRVARVRASLFEGAEASALTERSAKRAFGQRRST